MLAMSSPSYPPYASPAVRSVPRRPEARRLAQGQRSPARTLVDPPSIPWPDDTVVRVVCETRLIGLARWRGQVVHPYRIFCA